MKHTMKVTIFLIAFFILSQVFGLFLITKDAQITTEIVDNQTITTVYHDDTSMGPRPETQGLGSFIYIVIGVTIGTLLVLLLIKFKQSNIWRLWFFLAVWIAISISLGVLIKQKLFFDYGWAILFALALAIWKIFKPNIYVHNITEVLMYSGIAILLVPIFDVLWVIVLLLAVSVYDIYAVWKSKHMVKMAKFQTKSNLFAGLMVSYKVKKDMKPLKANKIVKSKTTTHKIKGKIEETSSKLSSNKEIPKNAILGGGDVVFPLIFSGAVLEGLIREGLTKSTAFMHASIITLTTAIALTLLFVYAKKGKFYPAMPFVTAGCLIGWLIVLLI